MTADRVGVTFSPPTPNGDFHLGHLGGPILGADVYSRARRLAGSDVRFCCSTDDNQTYVVTTARRDGVDPHDLIETAFIDGRRTLDRAAISVDLYATTDPDYTRYVRDAFTDLKRVGLFEQRTIPLPVNPADEIMTEAFVVGRCPHCNAAARAGSCEICFRYNTPAAIVIGRGQELPTRQCPLWVLDLERHRDALTRWYSSRGILARPVLRDLLEEGLRDGLPTIPITYPIEWGIDSGWGPGPQCINAWPEITVGHSYWMSQRMGPEPLDLLTQYMGVDNGFYNVFVYPILQDGLERAGRTPTANAVVTVANHYLQLSGKKFSTSKGHVVWAADALDAYDLDSARLAMALLSPELQEANYTPDLMASLIGTEIAPRLDMLLRILATRTSADGDPNRWARAADASAARFARAYDRFNPSIRMAGVQILNDLDVIINLADDERDADGYSAAQRLFGAVATNWSAVLPTQVASALPASADAVSVAAL